MTSSSPLFLCGMARSGTTYLLTLLNAAAPIHLTYESRMLKEGLALYEALPTQTTLPRFNRFLDELVTAEAENIRNMALIATLRRHQSELYELWCGRVPYATWIHHVYTLAYPQKPLWGDKLIRAEYMNWLNPVWPEARLILLYRDPRAVAASQKIMWQTTPELVAGYWHTHLTLSQQLTTSLGNRVLPVVYETLVQEPLPTLQTILHFIQPGLEQAAAAILAAHPPQPASLHKWRHSLTPDEIRQIEGYCFTAMNQLGYTPEIATAPHSLTRTTYFWHLWRAFKGVLWRPRLIIRKRLWSRLRLMLRMGQGEDQRKM
ncbi:MAG: sulfotransferase [Chloroflexi bacterium]|nr:sulfotransferase [Chloroflexota bacterium]MBP8056775.1 sulfotransferase [Chloroflexota bacterium]